MGDFFITSIRFIFCVFHILTIECGLLLGRKLAKPTAHSFAKFCFDELHTSVHFISGMHCSAMDIGELRYRDGLLDLKLSTRLL